MNKFEIGDHVRIKSGYDAIVIGNKGDRSWSDTMAYEYPIRYIGREYCEFDKSPDGKGFDYGAEDTMMLVRRPKNIKAGDRVRINNDYANFADNSKNQVGIEFTVKSVVNTRNGDSLFYVTGDPAGRGVWATFIDIVDEGIPCKVGSVIDVGGVKFFRLGGNADDVWISELGRVRTSASIEDVSANAGGFKVLL